MANTVEYIYEVLDRFSGPLKSFDKATARTEKSINRARAAMGRYSDAITNAGRGMRNFGGGLTAAVSAPLALFVGSTITAAASVETMTVAFESMLGSAENADVMVRDLLKFAAKTPFEFEGIGAATKQLLAIGVAQEDVIGKLQYLGDIAAGANVPLTDMASIFGKAKSKGKAMTEELLQLSDRGIPIIDVLAERLEISKTKIFDLASKGKISFEMLEGALQSMAGEGGIFHKQMIKQSQTLSGLWSTFKDALFMGRAEMGKTIVSMFGLKDIAIKIIGYVEGVTNRFKLFAETNPKIAKMAFLFGALVFVLGPLIAALGFVVMGIGAFAGVIATISFPIVAAVVAVAAFVGAMIYLYNAGHPVIEMFRSIWMELVKIGEPFAELLGLLGGGAETSITFSGAMRALGDAVYVALTPVKLMLQLLSTIVQTMRAIASGDLSAAWSAITSGAAGMKQSVADAYSVGTGTRMGGVNNATGYTPGNNLAEDMAAFKAQNSRLSVDGGISVTATPGTKVESSNINLNGGSNLATAW